MKKIQDAQINDKNVLLRIDADVPISDGIVTDAERLEASIPTLKYLLENGAKVTVIGHIGRPARNASHSDAGGPDGKEVLELKMRPVEDKLIELLGTHRDWQILENLRFDLGEEKNDPEFAKQLTTGQDLFVQDAFATCHRNHASTVGVAKLLSSYAGISVQKEVEELSKILAHHISDFTLIFGGAKIVDKIPVIKNLIARADTFLIGGAIGNTFLAARGQYHLGKSKVEEKSFSEANSIWNEIMDEAQKNIYLPQDIIISKSQDEAVDLRVIDISELQSNKYEDYFAVDIGPKTCEIYTEVISKAKMIFWNGNMGISEVEEFSKGTQAIAEAVAKSDAIKYAGGGDTTAFIRKMNLEDKFDFLSTGGGATLEFLAGKQLPGLKVLE